MEIADLKPSGKYVMNELVKIGGTVPLMKMLLDEGLMHGDALTVTGKTLAENLQNVVLCHCASFKFQVSSFKPALNAETQRPQSLAKKN